MFIVLAFLVNSNLSPYLTVALIIVFPFCMGWLIFTLARLISRSDAHFQADYRRPCLAEMTSACLVILGAFPTIFYLINKIILSWLGPISPELIFPVLGAAICLAAIVGTLVTYPFHLWMIRGGVIRWGGTTRRMTKLSRVSHGSSKLQSCF